MMHHSIRGDNPLISVIVPVYNSERYLAEALESVLAQTYRPLEVIVILDPRTTDTSEKISKRYAPAVRCYVQTATGLGAARNEGIQGAQGSLVAFLDADDLWVKEKLAPQMDALNADPTLDMVFGYIKQFYSPELDASFRAHWGLAAEIMPGYCAGTMLIRREVFSYVGLFETGWRMGDFVEWYARAVEKGLKSMLLPDVLMHRRIHKDNMGIREREHRKDYVRALKASLDRRRGKAL
jgi:glycosyltransferase involved in cell wall biosynthesis